MSLFFNENNDAATIGVRAVGISGKCVVFVFEFGFPAPTVTVYVVRTSRGVSRWFDMAPN